MRDLPVRPGLLAIVLLSSLALTSPGWAKTAPAPGGTPPFKTVVYIPVEITLHMKDRAWLESSWNTIRGQLHVDKVYLETYRSRKLADEGLVSDVKKVLRRPRGGGCRCNLLLRR